MLGRRQGHETDARRVEGLNLSLREVLLEMYVEPMMLPIAKDEAVEFYRFKAKPAEGRNFRFGMIWHGLGLIFDRLDLGGLSTALKAACSRDKAHDEPDSFLAVPKC